VKKNVYDRFDKIFYFIDFISILKWAQLVLTIERSCSSKQRFDYQGVYAIGADDKRDLMVIKRATKSKAVQRKGAIGNWKVNIYKEKQDFVSQG
jgi:hypothetical protein